MSATRWLLVVSLVGLTGCRRLPQLAAFFARPSLPPPIAEQVEPAPDSTMPPAATSRQRAPAVDRTAQVTVIGYHRFVEKVRHPDTEITPAEFESQMKALQEKGIKVISMSDFLAWRRNEKSIPPCSALITIDDGYNSGYTVAWPILKKLGYPATFFVYTNYIRGGPKSGGGSISWEELATLRDEGAAIESHTVSHQDLRGKKGAPPTAAADAWLQNELVGSKEMLEKRLGISVDALALPYGFSNARVRDAAMKAGYAMIFTVNPQNISFETPMDALGRHIIWGNQPKLFAAATTFEKRGGAGEASGSMLAAEGFQPLPADGAVVTSSSPLIRANFTSVAPIDPGSPTLRISGFGLVPAAFNPKTNLISYLAPNLPANRYTVFAAATSQGKKIEARWSFTVAASYERADLGTNGTRAKEASPQKR